ncbi:MAG: Fic family protein [Bacteroidales bacterium]|nr:Fic family protein [Bacteroidales bacterium]MBD5205598.1 Fic family protein [Bacteroidales bacterium]MBD5302996.1 Fic family protein [Bacteroides sp.]
MATPPFNISAEAINRIAEISALLERLNVALEGEHDLKLRKANRIKTIHSSLAIEGNTLSEDEVRDIINGKQVVAPIRQIQEVKNAIRVYDLYSRLNPFSEKDLLKAHSIMMEALTDDAGRYRIGGVGVFGESGLVHLAPPPQRVPELMADLFAWLKKSKDHLLIRSCVFHYEFEFIHPFSDGNGRTGRLWQSLILGRLNPLFEHLPVENMVYANQQEYYNAIAASTSEGQSGPFIDFMLNEILKTLQKNLKEEVPNKIPNKVPNKSELSILRLLADNPRLTRIELAEKVGISENGVKKIIANMKAAGWIERMGSNKTGYWIVQYKLKD